MCSEGPARDRVGAVVYETPEGAAAEPLRYASIDIMHPVHGNSQGRVAGDREQGVFWSVPNRFRRPRSILGYRVCTAVCTAGKGILVPKVSDRSGRGEGARHKSGVDA